MRLLVLSEHDVRQLLDMESCIEAMTEVLASLARDELFQPLRSISRPPGASTLLGLMPAYAPGRRRRTASRRSSSFRRTPRVGSTRTWEESSCTTGKPASSSRS